MTKEKIGECFICKKSVTNEDINQIEMITGPENTKVFVHNYHEGIMKELQEGLENGNQ